MQLHHVQLTIPEGKERVARGFYAGLLGMEEMEKPAPVAARGGCWFRLGDFELHLGAVAEFTPAIRGHPGVLVDDLAMVAARLEAGNIALEWDDRFPGHRRFYTHDPFGNRLEFLAPVIDPVEVVIAPLAPSDFGSWSGDVESIYSVAFSAPPYNRGPSHLDGFRTMLHRHIARPGFIALGACLADRLVGFTYGCTTGHSQWWHEQVRKALGRRAEHWLTDAFEYVELALDPAYRRLGIGRRLHDMLLAAQEHPRAVLSTIDAVTAGRRLYESSGWEVLVRGFRFERTVARYLIMGLEPARPAGSSALTA